MTTKLSGNLRLVMVAIVLLAVVVPGYLNRSAWIILLATPAFTALYALGKWNAWKSAWRAGGINSILLAILVTLPIQLILVGVLYLLGLGLSVLVGTGAGIQPLGTEDVIGAVLLFLFAVVLASYINVLEAKAQPAAPDGSYGLEGAGAFIADEEVELDIDPAPLTTANFYLSRGYWKPDALRNALQGRGERVVKQPEAAGDDAIAAAEARIGFSLPEGLRHLYKVLDGGYVGALYVPLQANAGPVFDDWRGAFAIDYSSLCSLGQLRTVKECYEDFIDDPDEIPANADRMIVLQQRYMDTTLLDYSDGPEPKVRLVNFDDYADRSKDVEFADFDAFFSALRRPRKEKRTTGDRLLAFRKEPIGAMMPAQQASEFWGSDAHVFHNIAAAREDRSEPKKQADDALIAETEARLGVTLPTSLVALWRYRNGGALAASHLQVSGAGEPYDEIAIAEQLMPMEYWATLADVSDRMILPEGEVPLKARHSGAERLVILQAKDNEMVLLDYRGGVSEPGVLIVADIEKDLSEARRVESFDRLLNGLRAWKKPF